jgi:hypothetical protein
VLIDPLVRWTIHNFKLGKVFLQPASKPFRRSPQFEPMVEDDDKFHY